MGNEPFIEQAVSQVETLTLKDIRQNPRVVWRRDLISYRSPAYRDQAELDWAAQQGQIRLVGGWSAPGLYGQTLATPLEDLVANRGRGCCPEALVRRLPELPLDIILEVAGHGYNVGLHTTVTANVDLAKLTSEQRRLGWDRGYLSRNRSLTLDLLVEMTTGGGWRCFGAWVPKYLQASVQLRTGDPARTVQSWGSWLAARVTRRRLPEGHCPNPLQPGCVWNREYLSRNRSLTVELMAEFDRCPGLTLVKSWSLASVSHVVPIEDVIRHPELDWDQIALANRGSESVTWFRSCPGMVNRLKVEALECLSTNLPLRLLLRYQPANGWAPTTLLYLLRNSDLELRDLRWLVRDRSRLARFGLALPEDHKLRLDVPYQDVKFCWG